MYSQILSRYRLAAAAAAELVLKSLLFFLLFLQLTQITSSQSITATQNVRQVATRERYQRLLIDPIVLDSDSLYMTDARRRKRSTATSTTTTTAVDACQSKMEVLTPYHATNSKGKLRTIVNSELMQQAIQVETCVR